MPDRPPERILVVKLSALGDILFATPALRALRQTYPAATLHFLVARSCRGIIQTNPHLDAVLVAPDLGAGRSLPGRLSESSALLRLLWQLRRGGYDTALLMHRSPWFGVLTALAGIPRRIGFVTAGPSRWLTTSVRFDLKRHRIDRHFDLVRPLGVVPGDPALEFAVPAADHLWARSWLVSQGWRGEPLIASSPGGGRNAWTAMPNRRWPAERFLALYNALSRHFAARLLLIGDRHDRTLIETLRPALRSTPLVAAGETTLAQTAALLAVSRVYIGIDSAPLFLAAAVGTPTVGLFGPTDARVIMPLGPSHIALQGSVPCGPCYNPIHGLSGLAYTCPLNRCMQEISVNLITAQVERLWRGERPGPVILTTAGRQLAAS